MAIRIFLMGKKKSYPQRSAWGKMQYNKFESIKVKAVVCRVSSEEEPSPDLSVETGVVGVSMQAILRTLVRKHRSAGQKPIFVVALLAIGLFDNVRAEPPSYEIEQGVALADAQNPEIIIARKKMEAARGGLVEARSGYLPSVISSGLDRKSVV